MVALEALRGDRTAQEIAAKHKVHPAQVTTWKRQAIDGLTGVFSDKVRRAEDMQCRSIIPIDVPICLVCAWISVQSLTNANVG